MATVSTADKLNLGRNITTVADKTPDQSSIRVQDVGAAGREKGRQASNIGTAMTSVSGALQQAHEEVRSRVDTIDRSRRMKQYGSDVTDKFTKFKTEGDASDPKQLESFKKELNTLRENALKGHSESGSSASMTRLQTALDAAEGATSATATEFADAEQIKIVIQDLDDDLQPLVAEVIANPGKLAEIVAKAAAAIEEKSPALTPSDEFDRLEAITQQLSISAVTSFTDIGAYDKARKLVSENPAILADLNASQQRDIFKKIETGERIKREARDKITNKKAAMEFALGRPLTARENSDMVLGKDDPLSPEGKRFQDREDIRNDDYDSEEERDEALAVFDRLTAATMAKPHSKVAKLQLDIKNAKARGAGDDSEEIKALESQIEKEKPGYKFAQKKIKLFPKARGNLRLATIQTKQIRSSVKDALGLIFDRELTPEELTNEGMRGLLKNLEGQELNPTATGTGGLLLEGLPVASDARSLQGVLGTIKGINITKTITEMRNNSPTGGALGSLSDKEGAYLAASKGTLEMGDPLGMIKTLIGMYTLSQESLDVITTDFNSDYAEQIESNRTGKPPEAAAKPPGQKMEDGTPIIDIEITVADPAVADDQTNAAEESATEQPVNIGLIPMHELTLDQVGIRLKEAGLTQEIVDALGTRIRALAEGQ